MPTKNEELEELLKEFLNDHADDKRHGWTMRDLIAKVTDFVHIQKVYGRAIIATKTMVDDHEVRIKLAEESLEEHGEVINEHGERLDEHRNAIINLKRHLKKSHVSTSRDSQHEFDSEMDTGSFDLAALRDVAELKSKRQHSEFVKAEKIEWWKRTIVLWVGGAVGALALLVLGILITLAMRK